MRVFPALTASLVAGRTRLSREGEQVTGTLTFAAADDEVDVLREGVVFFTELPSFPEHRDTRRTQVLLAHQLRPGSQRQRTLDGRGL